MQKIINDWSYVLKEEFEKDYFKQLCACLDAEYKDSEVYPPADEVFNAFKYTPLFKVKVVLLGQDPYPKKGQAMGLSFSVPPKQKIPPSLKNIYKELKCDYGYTIPNNGYLKKWADQGVLLLNTVLTVRANQPHSHNKLGWLEFTDTVIQTVNAIDRPIVFFLWGNSAKAKRQMLTNHMHCVFEAPHPSPRSANLGYFGCHHFSKANEFLTANGLKPIDWEIEDIVE